MVCGRIADEVSRVREALAGSRMLLVGGDYRASHARRIGEAFSLSGVLWIETRDSDASARRFRPFIERREVQIVVALVGLLRHQHAHDLRALCKATATPLVHVYRNVNPTMLAHEIVRQVGIRLGVAGVPAMRF